MNYYNGTDYDVLHPETTMSQVGEIETGSLKKIFLKNVVIQHSFSSVKDGYKINFDALDISEAKIIMIKVNNISITADKNLYPYFITISIFKQGLLEFQFDTETYSYIFNEFCSLITFQNVRSFNNNYYQKGLGNFIGGTNIPNLIEFNNDNNFIYIEWRDNTSKTKTTITGSVDIYKFI